MTNLAYELNPETKRGKWVDRDDPGALKIGGGFPPAFVDPDVKDRILKSLRSGNYLEISAALAGVGTSTLGAWIKRGRQESEAGNLSPYAIFYMECAQAMAEAEDNALQVIKKAAKDNWCAAAWFLERKYSGRWGKKRLEAPKSEDDSEVDAPDTFSIEQQEEMAKAILARPLLIQDGTVETVNETSETP